MRTSLFRLADEGVSHEHTKSRWQLTHENGLLRGSNSRLTYMIVRLRDRNARLETENSRLHAALAWAQSQGGNPAQPPEQPAE